MSVAARHLVLVGMMGVGKTTIGRFVAARLGRELLDSDALIEADNGRTVRQIFAADGEEAFRSIETGVLTRSLAVEEPAVIAAAGGVVLRAENRALLRESGARVVWLRAEPGLLIERVRSGGHRPLLDDDPEAVLRRMAEERDPLYREVADAIVSVDNRSIGEVVEAVLRLNDRDDPTVPIVRRVRVPLAERSYDVLVGHGVRGSISALLPATARRAAIVTQAGIPFGVDTGIDNEVFTIGHGEQHKSLATIQSLGEGFAAMGLTRDDVVIGVGGGMVTDIAGFAAASWHRGTPVVHVSTTLLGMVDAAIGGKTGVNLAAGKNLVGAFFQPTGVLCDLDALDTLPQREMRCGLGEMAKYHFLGGDDLLSMRLIDRIARCVEIKAEIVAADEHEGGRRALLNYGHTLAHALEIATGFGLAHGEAVAIGLIYAAQLGRVLGRIDDHRVGEHYDVVGRLYGLRTALPECDHEQLLGLMASDKKALTGLTFVLDSERGVEVVPGIPAEAAREALQIMASLDGLG